MNNFIKKLKYERAARFHWFSHINADVVYVPKSTTTKQNARLTQPVVKRINAPNVYVLHNIIPISFILPFLTNNTSHFAQTKEHCTSTFFQLLPEIHHLNGFLTTNTQKSIYKNVRWRFSFRSFSHFYPSLALIIT